MCPHTRHLILKICEGIGPQSISCNAKATFSKSLEIEDDIDVVIHLAAGLEHEKCSKEEFFKTNVDGTEQVLNLAHSKNAYFIYVSTTAIYGSPECPITENTPIDPNGNYALTKWNGEKICKKYENNGLEVTIIRSGPILGQRRLGIYKTIHQFPF